MGSRLTRYRLMLVAAALGLLAVARAPAQLPPPPIDPPPTGVATTTPPPVPGYPVAPRPTRTQPTAAKVRADDPYPGDDLMAPPPPVPPRTAYQRPPGSPPARPGDPPPQAELPDFGIPEGTVIAVPRSSSRDFRFIRRYGTPIQQNSTRLPDGTRRTVFTGGIIVNVLYKQAAQEMEFAADNAVVWVKGLAIDNVASGFTHDEKEKVEVELYLSGNVVIRTQAQKGPPPAPGSGSIFKQLTSQTVRADEIYYDVDRNRAVAVNADLEASAAVGGQLQDPVHLKGKEIWRLGLDEWQIHDAMVYSSRLPADPGLILSGREMSLVQEKKVRRNIFGLPYRDIRTGEKIEATEQLVTGRNVLVEVNDVPVFYLPRLVTNAADPLGPLKGITYGQDRIFGSQIYTTWDMYKLLALRGPPGHRWTLHADYLSDRGPGGGMDYAYPVLAPSPTGDPDVPGPLVGSGFARAYVINDSKEDILGGFRGQDTPHRETRGRAFERHTQVVGDEWFVQGQIAAVSDKNFLEQYYRNEWETGPNQETFIDAAWKRGNVGASALIKPKLGREWIPETMWLPRVDGAVIGQSFFDLLNYNVRGNAGYALARPTKDTPFAVLPTDQRVDTGRIDVFQELSVPFGLGPVKLAPYANLDLTGYSEDLTGNSRGRAYGGGGLRANLPFSKLYADADSELLDAHGLYHKASIGANYYNARSSTPYTNLPFLDRLNDDAIDQSYRNIRPLQTLFVPGPNGVALQNSPLYDIQRYAIRRVVDNRVDTLDSIQVLQTDFRQRLQTKRGYPGQEHVVDLASLDLSASYFPEANRDNFGHPFSFLEYDFLWNLGDRTSIVSNGWLEPYSGGPRYYTIGGYLDRPDRTSLYLGYRQTDPLRSKAVTASYSYQMSRKYSTTLSATYDFGIQSALSNSLSLTRTGTDLTFTVGVNYNALVNNFGVQFLVVPNLLAYAAPGRLGTTGLMGNR